MAQQKNDNVQVMRERLKDASLSGLYLFTGEEKNAAQPVYQTGVK